MSNSATTNVLTSLVDLISDAVKVVNTHYADANASVPPLESVESGLFDSPEKVSDELSTAIRTIEAACAQLSFTVANPAHSITNKAFGYFEPAALATARNGKISEILADKPEGLHITELSKESGIESGKLGHVLRFLATKHVFQEVKPDVFANNRLSVQLAPSQPVSFLVGLLTDELLKSGSHFADTMCDPKVTSSYKVEDAAFVRAHGHIFWDFYRLPENRERAERFSKAMIGWSAASSNLTYLQAFPWGSLPNGSTLVDYGGGNGHVSLNISKAFPQLKVVVQDLSPVIAQAEELWGKDHPEAVSEKTVRFVPFDFRNDSPVPNAAVYYVRHVLHNWPDDICATMLSNIKAVMAPDSKLLIHDYVLQTAVRGDHVANFEQAPEPLLPNYGIGAIRMYNQDLNMLAHFNSKQRTFHEITSLASQCGLKFVNLWKAGEDHITEFSLV